MRLFSAILAAFALTLAAPAFADKAQVYTAPLSRLAVGGYDPVAYFTQNAAVRGTAQITAVHNGFTYRFANADNRARFQANPSAYLPQYGGYCAWAVSQGYTAPGDPNAWRIVNGRLFLNYNADIQRRWDADRATLITRGDANWPNVLGR